MPPDPTQPATTDPKWDAVKCGIVRSELGSCLHTALRKQCDSHPTSALWNAIGLDTMTPVWQEYLDLFWANMPENGTTLDAAAAVKTAKAAAEAVEWGRRDRALLKCLFLLLKDSDWDGFTFYLWHTAE